MNKMAEKFDKLVIECQVLELFKGYDRQSINIAMEKIKQLKKKEFENSPETYTNNIEELVKKLLNNI